MMLIDTHSHVYLPDFATDRSEILKAADEEGVKRILMPAIDSSTHADMLFLEKEYPLQCFSMMGLHPCSVKDNYKDELDLVRDYLEKRRFKAIGEIGLDFYWDKSFIEQQHEAFTLQMKWALAFNLPIVIHSRASTAACIKAVAAQQNGKLRGVFHCFSGNTEEARQVIELGFLLGIGGVLTFKNSGLDKVMKEVGLEHVVLETDAPYLAPVPFRGKRNEPAYLKYVVEKLAEIRQCSREEVAAITTLNAEKLFGL